MAAPPITSNLLARYDIGEQGGVTDGERVTTLQDLSGNDRHLTSGTGAIFRAASDLRGLPALDFSANTSEAYASTESFFVFPVTIYCLVKMRATDSDILYSLTSSGFTLQDRSGAWSMFNGSQRGTWPSTKAPTALAASLTGGAGSLLTITSGYERIVSYSGSVNPATVAQTLQVGAGSGLARPMDGLLGPLIIYGEAHDASQQSIMLTWLESMIASEAPAQPVAAAPVVQGVITAMPGILVNGSGGGNGPDPVPTSGRGYPRGV